MANLKISQLTATTNNSLGSYLVINNSGETVTNKSQLEYVLGMTKGSGTNSIKSNDFLTANPSVADTESSIVLGNGASATTADEQIIIGKGAYGQSIGLIAIGTNAHDQGDNRDYGIAIGYNAEVYQSGAIVIGKDAGAVTNAFAIGTNARAIATDTIAIGNNSVVAGNYSTGIGGDLFSDKEKNTAIGYDIYSDGTSSTAIGADHIIGQSGGQSDYAHTFGYKNTISDGAQFCVVIGTEITNRCNGTIAISNEAVDLGDDSANAVFIAGEAHTVNTRIGRGSVVLGGLSNIYTNPGPYSFNYGGSGNTIDNSGADNSGIFHSVDSEMYDWTRLSGIYGSRNSYVSGNTSSSFATWASGIYSSNEGNIRNGQFSTIVGGSSNSIQEVASSSIIAGGENVIKGGGSENFIGGSGQSTIDNNNNINNVKNVILASDDAVLFDTDLCAIIGGDNNVISGGSLNFIFGGRNSVMRNDCFNSEMIGSDESTIIDVDFAMMLNSKDCVLSGASTQRNAMITCSGTTIRTGNNQIAIGLVGRTPAQADTTFVENLYYYQRFVSRVQSEQSGSTYTFDITQGSRGQLAITANTTITLSGMVDGASFVLKTSCNGAHLATWVAQSGFTILWSDNDDNPTNNGTDLWRFEVFGTTIYGQKIPNFQ